MLFRSSGTTTLASSANLTFDGSTLTAQGLVASTGSVRANNYCIAGNQQFYGNDGSVSCAVANTWYSLGTGTAGGIYIFRDATSGGTAVFAADSSAGATSIQNGIGSFQMNYGGVAGQMSVRVTGGTTPRTIKFVAVITNLA